MNRSIIALAGMSCGMFLHPLIQKNVILQIWSGLALLFFILILSMYEIFDYSVEYGKMKKNKKLREECFGFLTQFCFAAMLLFASLIIAVISAGNSSMLQLIDFMLSCIIFCIIINAMDMRTGKIKFGRN